MNCRCRPKPPRTAARAKRTSIDRAVHLARLAAFYPPCRDCACRGDARLLSPLEVRQWAELERRTSRGACFTAEGLEGSSANDVDPALARRFAGALAIVLWRQARRRGRATQGSVSEPTAIGRRPSWSPPPARRCDWPAAGRRSGRRDDAHRWRSPRSTSQPTPRCGSATRPAARRSIGLSCGVLAGRPWSSPGELGRSCASAMNRRTPRRPKRGGGELERARRGELYLAPIENPVSWRCDRCVSSWTRRASRCVRYLGDV